MTCWKKKSRNKVYPQEEEEEETAIEIPDERLTAEFMDKFEKEVIYCGGCKTPFNIQSKELKIHCNICNRFFHCKIAGECLGNDCHINGHRARYCYDCVGRIVTKDTCYCKDCLSDN
tara:strand:- start:8828 stop:9178 length:351 start_codon:yes stop_codon:yes gene_type:complete